MSRRSRRLLPFLLGAMLCAMGTAPTSAGIDVTVDAETLSELLSVMVPPSAVLDLTPDNRVTLQIEDVRVTGFDPGAENGGHILAAVRLVVPEIGLSVPLEPRLSLRKGEKDGRSLAYLQFENVTLAIPFSGPLDVASLLPRIPVPADQTNTIQTARGLFNVRTRLADTEIGSAAVRFMFDVEVSPVPPPPGTTIIRGEPRNRPTRPRRSRPDRCALSPSPRPRRAAPRIARARVERAWRGSPSAP